MMSASPRLEPASVSGLSRTIVSTLAPLLALIHQRFRETARKTSHQSPTSRQDGAKGHRFAVMSQPIYVVRSTFRAWIWPVYTGPKVPESAVSVVRKATLQAPPNLFGQFLEDEF
jgi:hypothetical protein